jgi:hypothetical protein
MFPITNTPHSHQSNNNKGQLITGRGEAKAKDGGQRSASLVRRPPPSPTSTHSKQYRQAMGARNRASRHKGKEAPTDTPSRAQTDRKGRLYVNNKGQVSLDCP